MTSRLEDHKYCPAAATEQSTQLHPLTHMDSFGNNDRRDFERADRERDFGSSDQFDSSTRSTGGYNNTSEFDSSNSGSGFESRRDRFDDNTNPGMGMGTGAGTDSSFRSGAMNDSSYGSSTTADTFGTSNTGSYGTGNDFNNDRSTEYDNNEFGRGSKPTMGDKLKGGAEKLAGQMLNKPGLEERGQERKMGEFRDRDNF
ncbi:Carbohydrate esterase family 4 protein [Mycena kentingensis (nom. inval.)]|nr:Carbohydrate esterase family 4 protein [Mycena kentingensis (nom. inval.)]